MSRHIDYNAAIPVAVCFLLRKVSANIRAIHFVGRPDRLRVRCDHSLPRLFGVVGFKSSEVTWKSIFDATTATVPAPPNGSSTRPPGGNESSRQRRTNSSEKAALCSPA